MHPHHARVRARRATRSMLPGLCACLLLWASPAWGQPLGRCGDASTPIAVIQGTAATSPLLGQSVVIEAVVVADFQAEELEGFFVQQADLEQDGDPNSSDGLFVYAGSSTRPAASGQRVRLRGEVSEYEGLTELTRLGALAVCTGAASASPQRLAFPLASASELERYEGMLVHIDQTLTVTGNFALGRYGTLDLSALGRLFQPTQLTQPGAAALAFQLANDRNRILLDDLRTTQNPSPIPYLDDEPTRRTGDTLAQLTGVLDERFGAYRIEPTVTPAFSRGNPRPSAPDVPGRLRVASFNVLNYFTTLDDGEPHCGPDGTLDCRGANTAVELERQRAKLVRALISLAADVIGVLEIENNPRAAIADLVAGLNAAQGAGSYSFVDTGVLGSDAIKVALIYRTGSVALVGAPAVLDSTVDSRFDDAKNRPALAQTFREIASDARFSIALNHWKSKGSACSDVGDPDLGDGQGNCNRVRVSAAAALVGWLAGDPTASGDPDVLIIGDLNSYAKEDPIATLEAGGFESLVGSRIGAAAYSYQFQGQFGYLDHALARPSLAAQVSGVSEWHINADEPTVLDYNSERKLADPFDSSDPYRASDHDPLVIGLELTPP
jgi:uncharacterized protein